MNEHGKTTEPKDRRGILSALWIFAMFNYLYADVFSLFFNPAAHNETLVMPQEAVLAFAVMMETAIAMVVLSRLLKYGVNRWANIIAGIFYTALVAWTLIDSAQPPFYVMFASIEIICTLIIAWIAWTWRSPQSSPVTHPALAH